MFCCVSHLPVLFSLKFPLTFGGGCEVFHGLLGKSHTTLDRGGFSKVKDVTDFPEVKNFKGNN